jgi:hypothetical protein
MKEPNPFDDWEYQTQLHQQRQPGPFAYKPPPEPVKPRIISVKVEDVQEGD